MGSALYVQQVPAGPGAAPVQNKTNPFLAGGPVTLRMPAAGGTFYGANEDNSAEKVAVIRGDGTTVLWDENDFPILDTAHDDAGGAIAAVDYLRVVATVNGQPIERVSSGGSPAAGQFIINDNAGTIEFETGTTYGVGTDIKVYVFEASDVQSQVVAADSLPDQGTCYTWMSGSVAGALEKSS